MKTTTAFGVLGSMIINLVLGLIISAVFSVTPAVQADEVAQCPAQRAEQPAIHAVVEHKRQGGHVVALRMGWEAG